MTDLYMSSRIVMPPPWRCAMPEAASAGDGELSLEPIGPRLAGAVWVQYRDPHIGEMTRLPELDSVAETRAWLASLTPANGHLAYAVMHEWRGFVGMVGMRVRRARAYVYFWIGCDHQGRGFGHRAAQLLCEQAEREGMRCLYTSAYLDNERSLRVLASAGFQTLPIMAREPDDDMAFLFRPLPGAHALDGIPGLRRLCTALDSPFRFDAPNNQATCSEWQYTLPLD